jgi:hypothetical protein
MNDSEGDAVRAMKEEHPEWFGQIREGLVIRPGDHLILSFPAGASAKEAAELRDEVQRRLPKDVRVTVVFGAEQIAVIREQDIRDAIQRYEDAAGMRP